MGDCSMENRSYGFDFAMPGFIRLHILNRAVKRRWFALLAVDHSDKRGARRCHGIGPLSNPLRPKLRRAPRCCQSVGVNAGVKLPDGGGKRVGPLEKATEPRRLAEPIEIWSPLVANFENKLGPPVILGIFDSKPMFVILWDLFHSWQQR